jgi:hypothetical protein
MRTGPKEMPKSTNSKWGAAQITGEYFEREK